MPPRRSKKLRSTKPPRKRKKIAPKKGRSSKKRAPAKKKSVKRSSTNRAPAKKKPVKRSSTKRAPAKKIVKKKKRKPVRVAPPPTAWPARPESSVTLKRGKIDKPPLGFERVVLSYEEERADFSDIMEKKQKLIDFAHAKEWRETGLPTSDELYDYLKWGADHFEVEIGQMYRFYLGYDVED